MSRHTKLRAEFNAQVRRRIRIVMAVQGMNVAKTAKASKLAVPTMNNVLNSRQSNPKLGHLARIAEGLNFSLDAIVGRKSLFAREIGKRVIAVA